jgi:hypothetical protein
MIKKVYKTTSRANILMKQSTEKYSLKIYSLIISKNFPLFLALVYLSAFIIDFTYTFHVLYNDKSYFLAHESNRLLQYSMGSGYWFIYPFFAIIFYSSMIIISKQYSHPVFRGLLLTLAILQLGTPLVWAFGTLSFLTFYGVVAILIHYPVYIYFTKNKKEGTDKGAFG